MPHTKTFEIEFCDVPGYGLNFNMTPHSGGVHECRRMAQVKWADAHAFPAAVLGESSAFGGQLLRLIPEQHPRYPHLWATQCNLQNGQGAHLKDYDELIRFADRINSIDGFAIFEIVYSTLPYDVAEVVGSELERYVSREGKFNLEVYQIPGDAFLWRKAVKILSDAANAAAERLGLFAKQRAAVSQIIPEPVPQQRPVNELRYTWHWVPEPIPAHIYQIEGKVNLKKFDGVGRNESFPPQSLLLSSIEKSELKWTPSGTPVRDIVYTFNYRPDSTWQKLYRKVTNDFEEVMVRKTGAPLFPTADFDNLFKLQA